MTEQIINNTIPYPKYYNGTEWDTKIINSRKFIPYYLREDLPKLKYQLLRDQFKEVSQFECPKIDYFSKALAKMSTHNHSHSHQHSFSVKHKHSQSNQQRAKISSKKIKKMKNQLIDEWQYALLLSDKNSNILEKVLEKAKNVDKKISQIQQHAHSQNQRNSSCKQQRQLTILTQRKNPIKSTLSNQSQLNFNKKSDLRLPTLGSTTLDQSAHNLSTNLKSLDFSESLSRNQSKFVPGNKKINNKSFQTSRNQSFSKRFNTIDHDLNNFSNKFSGNNSFSMKLTTQKSIDNSLQQNQNKINVKINKKVKQEQNLRTIQQKQKILFSLIKEKPKNKKKTSLNKKIQKQSEKTKSFSHTLSKNKTNCDQHSQQQNPQPKKLYISQLKQMNYFPNTSHIVFQHLKMQIYKQQIQKKKKNQFDLKQKQFLSLDKEINNKFKQSSYSSFGVKDEDEKSSNKTIQEMEKINEVKKLRSIEKSINTIKLRQFY